MRRWCLFSLVLMGCQPGRIEIEIPIGPNDRSAIVALRTGDQIQISATGVATPSNLPAIEDYVGDDLELYVLLYEDSLDTLGLSVGLIADEPDLGERLPAFGRAFSTTLPMDWREIEALPDFLENLRVRVKKRCPELSIVRRQAEASSNASMAVRLDDGSVIVAAGERAYRVRGPEDIVPVELPDGINTSAGTRAGGNRVWIASTSSVVLVEFTDRARILRSQAHPPGGGEVSRMVAGIDELYTFSRMGLVSRLAGGSWSTVHTFEPGNSYTGLAYRSSGKIAAAATSSTKVALYNAGRTRLVDVPGVNSGITHMTQIDGWGVVLSQTTPRQLHVLDDAGWRTLPDSVHGVLACGLIGFGGGIAAFGSAGQGALYLRDQGVCPLDVLTVQTAHHAAPLGRGIVIPSDERRGVIPITFINPI
jgi:hypothetical protein